MAKRKGRGDDERGRRGGRAGAVIEDVALAEATRTRYLNYALSVITSRALPDVRDGLKPVQRRILHAMYELEDGRYNKVAKIVGETMGNYHPHGDVSITDALVQLAQRELLIDTQGNWGNVLTGDAAAAPRYIEARLTKELKVSLVASFRAMTNSIGMELVLVRNVPGAKKGCWVGKSEVSRLTRPCVK